MIPPPLQRRLFHSTIQRLNRIGPPHPISNIRPIIYDDLPPPPPPQQQHPYSLEEFSTTQETVKDETVFRMQRTQLDQFNQHFWLDVCALYSGAKCFPLMPFQSNTRFEAGKEAVLSSLPSTSSALDKENALSEFYRHWLVQETERTESYTQEWRRRNKQNIILASRIAFRRLLQWPTSKK